MPYLPDIILPRSMRNAKLHCGEKPEDLQRKFLNGELTFSELFSRSRLYLDMAAYYQQSLVITYQGYKAFLIEPASYIGPEDSVRDVTARGALRSLMQASLPNYMKEETLSHSSVDPEYFDYALEEANHYGGAFYGSTVIRMPTQAGTKLIVRNVSDFNPEQTYSKRPIALPDFLKRIKVNSRA